MIIDYAYHDTASSDIEIQNAITEAIKYQPASISVLPPYIRIAKSLLPSSIKLSCPIDYPLGILDTKSRLSTIEFCLRNGADIIEPTCQAQYLCNRKYDKFRDDIKQILDICGKDGVEVRYILEYRQYSYELLYKIAQILYDFNIRTIYPSTGYSLDEINDNIIAAALINKKVSDINIICTGNIWNKSQVKLVKNSQLYGLRVNSINALQLLNFD